MLKVVPVASAVLISGYVDDPASIDRIVRIAEEFYPKVINNMTVGGTQQVKLHVKVMEVSRTKLRQFGMDWAKVAGGNVMTTGITGLLSDTGGLAQIGGASLRAPATTAWRTPSASTFSFQVVNGNSAFFGVLDALQQDNLMKIMSEPTLTTISGRPAFFNSGGEIPVPEPQSLGTISISWKKYGTQVEFVPIVLGNGRIRLEVRPRISELDSSQSITISGTTVPGIKSRESDNGAEMEAGQTMAIAGLIQTFIESESLGLPWISDLPYIGAAFRSVHESRNDVELIIMVTPELVEPMDPEDVPRCGPGTQTTSPSDWELYMKGHLEVPNCCPANGAVGSGEPVPAPQPEAANPRNPQNRNNPSRSKASTPSSSTGTQEGPPGLIGPAGYDVVK